MAEGSVFPGPVSPCRDERETRAICPSILLLQCPHNSPSVFRQTSGSQILYKPQALNQIQSESRIFKYSILVS